ncbi:MAG: OprD family outer membrane porin [Cyclobacteriaceae bacterium]
MTKKLILIALFVFSGSIIYAQNDDEKVQKGQLSGQWRSFYLGTINKDELKDFHGLATGGKLKYTHAITSRLQLGAAFYTSVNLGIQDLTLADPVTRRVSRYEAGLFDVQNLNDRFIGILGELYAQYSHSNHNLTVGRMKIKSPLLNPQDGRMIPTLAQGFWYKYQPEKWKMQLGFFNQIAPRSTSGFFDIGESIGKYPVGRNINGTRSLYGNNTSSKFVAIANVTLKPLKNMELEMWNYYVENIFNTVYIKPNLKIGNKTKISAEWLHQDQLGTGGNRIDSLRYFVDKSSNIIGLQIERKIGQSKWSIGYDHILKGGRFLFPREWGRESLFSFQKRERSEGTANNHALLVSYDRTFGTTNKVRSILSAGYHWKPTVTNTADNKYALPSCTHINMDLFWEPQKLKGLRPELLLTYKRGLGHFPDNPNFILNKVDMFQVNLIINYNF